MERVAQAFEAHGADANLTVLTRTTLDADANDTLLKEI